MNEDDVKTAQSECDVHTARSECETSSKDVLTAREITDDVLQFVQSAQNLGDAPKKQQIASIEEEVKTAQSESDVCTARSECETSSKDVLTAREITDDVLQLVQSLAVGVLPPDIQRSVTEVHGSQQELTQTPQTFDARASLSAQNLGDAPNKQQLASVEEVKTGRSACNTPTKGVNTARSECETSSKDVYTAREITYADVLQLVQSLAVLPPDIQRSVTEVHGSQQELTQTPQTFDARASLSAQNLGDAPNKQQLASIEELKTGRSVCNTPTKSVNTARSECETSSKDVLTAREITDDVLQLVQSIHVGVLPPDIQRSVTEVHGSQQELTQTPQTFDARASLSAQNLGDAPNKQQLASIEDEVKTARSESDVKTARSESDVKTARSESGVKTARSECDTPTKGVNTARSECETLSKEFETAREITDDVRQLVQSLPVLAPDIQRSVTEVHGSQQELTQTPQTFDARASLSAQNLGDAPNKQQLASVEEVKTGRSACNTPTKGVNTARSECETSSKDVYTAREITYADVLQLVQSLAVLPPDIQRSVTEVHGSEQELTQTPQTFDARASLSAQNLGDAPNKQQLASIEDEVKTARSESDVKTARSESDVKTAAETSTSDITSLSRYHSFENIHPELEDDELPSTPEQLIALDRQKSDPPSYYFEPSLNKGPVDQAPRLRQVPSEYAVYKLSNYAMDEASNAYKLKSQALPMKKD